MSHFHVNPGDRITIDHSIVLCIGKGWIKIIGPKDMHCNHSKKEKAAKENLSSEMSRGNKTSTKSS